ncbi:MAG: hypothetical protein Q9162_006340 [Coniocarpon cinnabarinum]
MPVHDVVSVVQPPELVPNPNPSTSHATCPTDDDGPTAAIRVAPQPSPPSPITASPALPRPRVTRQPRTPAEVVEARAVPQARARHSQPARNDPTRTRSLPTTERSTLRRDGSKPHAAAPGSQPPASPRPAPQRAPTPPEAYHITQHTSSFLRNGSRFVGTQQSDRQVYNVTVELKHVDMRESFLCGYLCIEGLTDQQRLLTTYFEGEIVGHKYGFLTRHPDWRSNPKVDVQHWQQFPAWAPLCRQAQSENFTQRDYVQREHLFMRWKEHFLVPDHRVTRISGASFEGFYFICFNQVQGTISGIYFHAKSERFQQLELRHVHDYGCHTAREFA